MTQNSMSKAKLEDISRVTGRPFFSIDEPTVTIGRSVKNDLVIKKNTVSARHTAIKQIAGGYVVVDLNSTNKTVLNGEELTPNMPKPLKNGDEISIDTFSFIFMLEQVDLPKPVEPPQPDPDGDETMFLDEWAPGNSGAVPAATGDAPDSEETIFFDGSSPPNESEAAASPPPEPESDETIFFDSSSSMDEPAGVEPPPPEPESDETIFFDSSSSMDEPAGVEPSPPDPESDETIFFDTSASLDVASGGERLLEDEERTIVRDKPAASKEVKKFGSYEVINLLGRGGFGSVWKAKTPDGQPVAVKVLNPDVLGNDRAVRKFFHEAIILSKMNHPNICSFFDFFPQDGNYAIVMDFVQGTDLKDLLKGSKGPLPFDLARRIASQTLDAFHYAYEKDVLHRDIKPENITLDREGRAIVMDFGIARLSSSESQQTSLFMISPAYTAPERFDANKTDTVDHHSDIYSLGLVFYEIFTGTHPFPTTNPTEMIVAHLNTVPPPPHTVADLPREISDAILKALEKDPEDRFEDFAAFKMEMLGEAPLRSSQSMGPIEISGEHCKSGVALLKTLTGIVKKHQKKASKIIVGQVGTEVNLIIESTSGNTIRITRNIENL